MTDPTASLAGASATAVPPRRGRPRDPGKDSAIRAATMGLLAEVGYPGLTMEQVAVQAGVSKASLYLRWPNKVTLVADTLRHHASGTPDVPDTGSLAGDVRVFLWALLRSHREAVRALIAVAGEIPTNPALRVAWQEGLAGTLTDRLRAVVGRAAARGELPADADVELLARLPLSLLYNWRLDHDQDPDDEVVERIVRQFPDRPPTADTGTAGQPAGPTVAKPAAGRRRGRRRGELTIAAIARLAGVSAPTVSKVLNGRTGVAPQTRQRVEALLREHEYRRPEVAEPAACVEVIFFGLQSDLAIGIMRGVEQVACEQHLAVGFVDVLRQVATGRSWIDDLLARRPTGVVAVNLAFTSEQHALLGSSAIPLVALDPTGEPPRTVPSVGVANWSGAVTATRHLLDLGHRRIGVITGPTEQLCARARLDGARATLDAAGVPVDERLVRTGWFSFEDGLKLAREVLCLPERPTAVLCGNDLQALGVYEAARQAGLRIPEDLSVVGFDDIQNTRWCWPPMTTVRQPLTEMGATAARLVRSLAAGETLTRTRIELATSLIVRDSTAPPPVH